jgi:hypothetical protein
MPARQPTTGAAQNSAGNPQSVERQRWKMSAADTVLKAKQPKIAADQNSAGCSQMEKRQELQTSTARQQRSDNVLIRDEQQGSTTPDAGRKSASVSTPKVNERQLGSKLPSPGHMPAAFQKDQQSVATGNYNHKGMGEHVTFIPFIMVVTAEGLFFFF